jgi:hypothetical protein
MKVHNDERFRKKKESWNGWKYAKEIVWSIYGLK